MSQRVLVADDSRLMRKIIGRALDALGIADVCDAANGAEAIEKFTAGTFDLVLLDWNMPEKSGLEVLKEIRAQGSDVPVIMITTESEEGRVSEAIQAGVTDYLPKPFNDESIREKLETYLTAAT